MSLTSRLIAYFDPPSPTTNPTRLNRSSSNRQAEQRINDPYISDVDVFLALAAITAFYGPNNLLRDIRSPVSPGVITRIFLLLLAAFMERLYQRWKGPEWDKAVVKGMWYIIALLVIWGQAELVMWVTGKVWEGGPAARSQSRSETVSSSNNSRESLHYKLF